MKDAGTVGGKLSGEVRRGEAKGVERFPHPSLTPGKARDKVGESLGVSGKTVPRGCRTFPVEETAMPRVPQSYRPVLVSPPGQGEDDDQLPLDELVRRLEELRRHLPADIFEAVRRVILGEDDPPE